MNCRRAFALASAVFCASAAAQQTTNINININLTSQTRPQHSVLITNRSVTPFGVIAIRVDVTHPRGQGGGAAMGDDQGTISFVLNRLESFDVTVDIPNGPGAPAGPKNFTGAISGGSGA